MGPEGGQLGRVELLPCVAAGTAAGVCGWAWLLLAGAAAAGV